VKNILAAGLWKSFIRRSKHFCIYFQFSFHEYILFFLIMFFVLQNSTSRKIKLSSTLSISREICNSTLQTKRVHGSVFCDQTMHFRTLVPTLKHNVLISSIVPRNLSFDFLDILYTRTMCNAILWGWPWSKHYL